MNKNKEKITDRDLIVASILCLIALASFYVAYRLGRDLGSLIFT